jgi:hypothetical protein
MDEQVTKKESPYMIYLHHGRQTWVRKDLKGTHRRVCLCYQCASFAPGLPETNCPIANLLYAVSLAHGTVTPVFECPVFVLGDPYAFKTPTGQP